MGPSTEHGSSCLASLQCLLPHKCPKKVAAILKQTSTRVLSGQAVSSHQSRRRNTHRQNGLNANNYLRAHEVSPGRRYTQCILKCSSNYVQLLEKSLVESDPEIAAIMVCRLHKPHPVQL